jgi:hypothetical protein
MSHERIDDQIEPRGVPQEDGLSGRQGQRATLDVAEALGVAEEERALESHSESEQSRLIFGETVTLAVTCDS